MSIICIDMDDCLLPYKDGIPDIETMYYNLAYIQDLIKSIHGKIFITGTWYKFFIHVDDDIKVDIEKIRDIDDDHVLTVLSYLTTMFNERVHGISSGNRDMDILKLIDDGYNVIAVDDMRIGVEHDNFKHIKCTGVFDRAMFMDAINFIKGKR